LNSDGDEYVVLGANLDIESLRLWLRHPYHFVAMNIPNMTCGDKLRAECWLISATNHGGTSQVTLGMRFLIQELRPGFGDIEFEMAMDRLQQRPNASIGQIAASRLYPDEFKSVLNTMLTGSAEGWLVEISKNSIACEVRQPKWGVWVNGAQTDIALCVVTNQQELEISQGSCRISRKARSNRIIVKMAELLRENFDLACPFSVANHNIVVPQLNGILLARRHVNEVFCEFIDRNAKEAISAANLWVLAVCDNVQFCLGGTPANVVQRRNFLCGNDRRYLYEINLTGINGYENSTFTADSVPLVQIGPIPAIEISGAEPMVASFNEKDTLFVFGQSARISVAGIDPVQIQWNASNGGSVQLRQEKLELSCDQHSWGKRIIASTEVAGRKISQPVRFLPPEMREAMQQETEWSNCNDLRWTPDSDAVDIRREVENTGLVSGTLRTGGSDVKIWHPSTKPHHWFNEGLYDATVRDFGMVSTLVPNQVDLLNPPQLHIYIPEGMHKILVGGADWLVDLEGPGYWREKIEHCPEWIDRLDDEVVLLNVSTAARHIIACFNDRPQGMTLSLPISLSESIEEFCKNRFTIQDLENRLRPMVVGGDPIAASPSWTGSALSEKLSLLNLRYTIAPDNTTYIPPRSVTLQELRGAHLLIDGLARIQTSNHPDLVWMPTSVFRIAPNDALYGYHPLPLLRNQVISLGDPRQHSVSVRYKYGRATEFTIGDQRRDYRWDIRANDKDLIRIQSDHDPAIAIGDLPSDWVDGYFRGAMVWAEEMIGQDDIYHLGGLFPEVCNYFSHNPTRRFIFQTAVLCRLRAWHGIAPGSVDERIQSEVLREQLARICWRISQTQQANDIFISDLLTVEWTIAWFNNFNPK